MQLIYTILIILYGLAVRIAAIFNVKARQWVDGRRGLFRKLEQAFGEHDRQKNPVMWFHASSLGEFEQGRPIIEDFRKKYPGYKILLTFFSPSGYEVRRNYDQADWIFYLPLDTPSNARRFIAIVRPPAAIFIKYDFWYNLLGNLYQQHIPVYFASAVFRPGQYFFKWYGRWGARRLGRVRHFFVQTETSAELLASLGLHNVTVTGDTRFDRVFAIASQKHAFPLIEKFIQGKRVFIGGSTWQEDEALLFPLVSRRDPDLKFIIAPHDTSSGRIQQITEQIKQPVLRYSALNESNAQDAEVLIIDSVGILAQLYQYATLAFIGGGFGAGLHNIQEPITYGVPVFFGPRYHKFREAVELVQLGGVFSVTTTEELISATGRMLADTVEYRHVSDLCRDYVEKNRGATAKIMQYLDKELPLHAAPGQGI
jgi:3-deoxy-D-manno-octulosonic-acid transferase